MWENWLTNTIQHYVLQEQNSYSKKNNLSIKVCDLEVRKINLYVDIVAGLFKQAILLGKWCYCFKDLNHKKINFLDKVIISQNKVLSFFNYSDGFSEVSKIVDIFLLGHKYYLYDYFGKDDEWDNEILCNAILKYSPIRFNNNIVNGKKRKKLIDADFYVYKQMYLIIKNTVTQYFEEEIKQNILPVEEKFINFWINFIEHVVDEFEVEGIVLFVKYMNNWRQYFLSKKEGNNFNEEIEYNDALDNDFDSDTVKLKDKKYSYYYDYDCEDRETNLSQSFVKSIVGVSNDKFWKKINNLLEPIENKIIKMRFINNFSFDKIASELFLDKEICQYYYHNALDKIRTWILTRKSSVEIFK